VIKANEITEQLIPADEYYFFCARANDWRGSDSHVDAIAEFEAHFQPIYIRQGDKTSSMNMIGQQVLLITALSSTWLFPYLASIAICFVTFEHGLRLFLLFSALSCITLLTTPLMMLKSNRDRFIRYLGYFLGPRQADETRLLIKNERHLWQSVFCSSLLIVGGTLVAYTLQSHGYCDREDRNTMLRITLALSLGWLVFFICRSFEGLLYDWFWVPLSFFFTQRLCDIVNPFLHDKLLIISLVFHYGYRRSLYLIVEMSSTYNNNEKNTKKKKDI
jgi:hypothetical protein